MMRGECTAGMDRTFPTEDHFYKAERQLTYHIGKNTHRNLGKKRKQRNMLWMKEQGKTPEELSEGKTGNLPKKTVVKIMKEFWRKEWMHRVSSQKL